MGHQLTHLILLATTPNHSPPPCPHFPLPTRTSITALRPPYCLHRWRARRRRRLSWMEPVLLLLFLSPLPNHSKEPFFLPLNLLILRPHLKLHHYLQQFPLFQQQNHQSCQCPHRHHQTRIQNQSVGWWGWLPETKDINALEIENRNSNLLKYSGHTLLLVVIDKKWQYSGGWAGKRCDLPV